MLEKILVKEIVGPIVVIFSCFLVYCIIKKIIKRMMTIKLAKVDQRRQKTINVLILNIIKYFLIIIAIIIILSIYGVNMNAVVASLGAVGVVVGLAFQDILKDCLSGISIIVEDQYKIGDTVTINNFKGEVLAIGFRTTRLKAYTGEIKIISNRNIQEVINHSFSTSKAIIDITVSYDEDLTKVEKVLTEVCDRMTKEIKELKGKIEVLGINKLGDSGVEYRVAVDTKPMKHIEIQRILLRQIKLEFDKNKIEIPYNQLVIHNA